MKDLTKKGNKLTIKEKIKIYSNMRDILINQDDVNGFCYACELATKDEYISYDNVLDESGDLCDYIDICFPVNFKEYLPELFRYYPEIYEGNECYASYWFPTYEKQKRIDILNEVIDKLKNK